MSLSSSVEKASGLGTNNFGLSGRCQEKTAEIEKEDIF